MIFRISKVLALYQKAPVLVEDVVFYDHFSISKNDAAKI